MTGRIIINGSNILLRGTILDAALRNGVGISVLRCPKDIEETAACRICLVEVEGIPVPAACRNGQASPYSVKILGLFNISYGLRFLPRKVPFELQELSGSMYRVRRSG